MEKRFQFKSKLYVVPAKTNRVMVILMDISLVLILLSGIVKLLTDGFSVGVVGYMCIAYLIVSAFRSKPQNEAHYEFSMADMLIAAGKITVTYDQIAQNKGKKSIVVIDIPAITSLEYSEKLSCLRICGAIRKLLEGENEGEVCGEHYLYVEKEQMATVMEAIGSITAQKIVYMDR